MKVKGLGVPGLHLWQLVADDLHQHRRELHFQGLGLSEGVEAEFQQVTDQLQHRRGQDSEASSPSPRPLRPNPAVSSRDLQKSDQETVAVKLPNLSKASVSGEDGVLTSPATCDSCHRAFPPKPMS